VLGRICGGEVEGEQKVGTRRRFMTSVGGSSLVMSEGDGMNRVCTVLEY
jgi:hypothetical protein